MNRVPEIFLSEVFGELRIIEENNNYFGEKKDHMSTPVIADEAARETLAKEGVEIIEKLVERMDMNHIVAQMRELEHYNSEVAKKCPWVPSNTKTER